jgi:hypothetical protein
MTNGSMLNNCTKLETLHIVLPNIEINVNPLSNLRVTQNTNYR